MKRLLAAGLAALAAGCASAGGDPRDPWEGMNRGIYRFNDGLDEWVGKPVATAYRDLLHNEIRLRVRNFFANLQDPFIGVNNMLQGKIGDGFSDWMRFVFNSTIGLLGLHDVASDMGYDKHNEDFGQTFGRWGMGAGPYLMLPVLGPSSVRDGGAYAIEFYTDPLNLVDSRRVEWTLRGIRLISVRADLLDASRLLEEAALDRYVFIRDAYFQRRRSLIYDGRPPREEVNEPAEPTVK